MHFPWLWSGKNCCKWVVGEELFKTKSLGPIKILNFMVEFQNFRLQHIIVAMEAIKCSWTIIYKATLHYRINVALFLLFFAEISCATFISHAQLLFIFKNFECATFIRLRYICIAAWCFINNRCFKANLKHLMSCHVFLLSILCMLD